MKEENQYFNYEQRPGLTKEKCLSINDGKPLISILTAYYNSKEYIRETANSLFNQTFPYWEWIIVDDGSTEEGTKELLKNLQNEDSRIKVYYKKNEGPSKTRMYAFQKITTDLIFILDSDDVIDKTFLECGYFTLLTNPNASWTYTNMVNFGQQQYLYNRYFHTKIETKENVICGNSIIRKKAFEEVGGYGNEEKIYHEDWQLWLKLLAKGHYPVKMNFYGFWYRRRDGVLSSINGNRQKDLEAKRQIKAIARQIKIETSGIQYPESDKYNFNARAYQFEWNRKPIVSLKSHKKNLLFIFPWFTVGGADRFNIDLLSDLDKEKYHITIVTTEIAPYIWRQQAEKYGEFFDLNTFLSRENWAAFIAYLMKSRNIDLVMVSNSLYGYYVIPWLKSQFPKIPFVDYLHAEDFSWRDGGFPRDSIAISRLLDKTYTCSNHLQDIMNKKMNRKIQNMETVYIGVNDKKFFPTPKINHDFDFTPYQGKKVILFICRIYELKRPIFALNILKKIKEKRDEFALFVVGDGPDLADMKQKAVEFGIDDNVAFFGMQENTLPFYQRADITLICSLTEGLALTTYESLSSGTPVVTADVGGHKELIDNSCGKVIKKYQSVDKDLYNRNYDEKEIEEYANAILEIIDNKDYDKMCQRCRQKVEAKFSIYKMAEKMDKEFEELVKNGSTINSKSTCNEELANNYLILYFELYKRYISHENPKALKNKLKRIREVLWQLPPWRVFIKICQKLGLTKITHKLTGRK